MWRKSFLELSLKGTDDLGLVERMGNWGRLVVKRLKNTR